MKPALFKGAATAIVTPFLPSGGIDEEALRKHVHFQIENGIQALIACGTTGEPATLNKDEWTRTIQIVVEETKGRVPVIAGTGGNNTATIIADAKRAKNLGADGQLCVTPYYNKTTQEGLVAHYQAISDESDLPIIVYNVPGRTGLDIQPATIKKLAAIPKVVGVKEASGNVAHAADMVVACEHSVAFYSGSDEVNVPLMSVGFQGAISVLSNVVPKETAAMINEALDGNYGKATELQLDFLPLIRLLFVEVNPIPAKAALALMGRMHNVLRLPLVPMSQGNQDKLRAELQRMGLL